MFSTRIGVQGSEVAYQVKGSTELFSRKWSLTINIHPLCFQNENNLKTQKDAVCGSIIHNKLDVAIPHTAASEDRCALCK